MNARCTTAALLKRLVDRTARCLLPSCGSAVAVVLCWCDVALADRPHEHAWTQWIATPVDDFDGGVAVDRQGHVYFAGTTYGNLAGSNAGWGDVFLVKYSAEGGLIWIRQFGTTMDDWVVGVEVDHNGDVWVAGLNSEYPALTTPFVAKLDGQGSLLWMRQYATTVGARCFSLALDNAGNALICGDTAGDLGGPSAGALDGWVTKLDSEGRVVWNAQIGSPDWDNALAVGVDNQNQVYITGFTFGDLAGPSAGERDIYIAKFDADGHLLWARQIGTDDVDMPECLTVDSAGNPVVGGQTEGDLGGRNQGYADGFLAKFDDTGNTLWISQVGTLSVDRFNSVAIDAGGSFYIAGATAWLLGGPPAGLVDAVLAKFEANGSFAWARQFGTAEWEYATDVALDHFGAAYLCGSVFDGENGPSDAFLIKFVPTQRCADITGDGGVDIDDLMAVIGAWGPCPAPPLVCDADIDGDGSVELDDLLAVIGGWGACQ